MKEQVEKLIENWETELCDLMGELENKGSEPNSYEYNLMSTSALRLSMCIIEAKNVLIGEA